MLGLINPIIAITSVGTATVSDISTSSTTTSADDIYKLSQSTKSEVQDASVGDLACSAGVGTVGGALGSIIPGIGNAIGLLVGGVVGAALGESFCNNSGSTSSNTSSGSTSSNSGYNYLDGYSHTSRPNCTGYNGC